MDADGDSKPSPGDTLQYTITYTNTGTSDLTGAGLVSDFDQRYLSTPLNVSPGGTVGDGTVSWDLGTIAAGATGSVTYQAVLKPPAQFPAGTAPVTSVSILDTDQTDPIANSASITVTGDVVPPTTTATETPAPNAAGWNNTDVKVVLSAVDNPGGSGVDRILYAVDGGPASSVAGNTVPLDLVDEGTHTVQFQAVDVVGNVEPAQTIRVRIDKTPPTSSVNSLAPQQTSSTFSVTVTGSDPSPAPGVATSGVTSFDLYVSTDGTTYSLDATLPAGSPDAGGVYTATTTFTGQNDTTYYFYAVAHDAAGNTQSIPTSAQAQTHVLISTATAVSLQSSENPSKFGDPVTFTATVTAEPPGSGTPTGTVTFYDGATSLGTGQLDAMGQATFLTSTLSVGSHPITAVYDGDGNFITSTSSPLSQTVNQAATTTTLAVDNNPSVYGQSVTLSATVGVVSPGSGSPSGSVTFFDGSTPLGTANLVGNQATLPVTTLATSSHNLTAQYLGDGNFTGSTSPAVSETVNQASTTTALAVDNNPAVYGQQVTLTATIGVSTPGAGTPTGSVTFYDGTTPLGTANLVGSQATLPVTTLAPAVAAQSLTAQYLGDGNFAPSTSPAVSETVNQASTTTALAVDNNPAVYGQQVTLTATIGVSTPGAGTPTGSVTFYDGTTPLGTANLVGSQATLPVTTLAPAVAAQSLTAQYLGDGNFAPSTSPAVSETVNQASTTTALSVDHNPSAYGQSVTFTASVTPVSPGAGVATGTVTFKDGTTVLGNSTLGSNGIATFSTSALSQPLAVGSHSITATYNGDTNFVGSPSVPLSETVVKNGGTMVTVTSSVNPSVLNQPVNFTVTVSAAGSSGIPTGSVTFKDGTKTLVSATLNSSGMASFSTTTLAVGSQAITAVYSGDANFAASTSPVFTQVVNKDGTTTSVVSSVNPSSFGQSVTFTATVTAGAFGTGTPTGSVTFKDGTKTLGTVGLTAADSATYTTSKLATGSQSITATYNGNATFAPSTSPVVSETVNQASTTTALEVNNNPSVYGQSVTFTATVNAAGLGSGTPTGSVTFMDGTNPLGSATLKGSGLASFSTTTLAVGSQSITAVYRGDGNFTSSTSTALTQTVNQDATTTSLKSSPSSSIYGQPVTFTATVSAATPGSGTPTGSVTFMDGSTELDKVTLTAGKASFKMSALAVGSHSITAVYGGDGNFTASPPSTALAQTVTQDATTTSLKSSSSSIYGQPVTFTATVAATAPGSGTPTGTVNFLDNGTQIGTGTLGAGKPDTATFTTSSLLAGAHTITASYTGDSNFTASTTSTALALTVNQAATKTTVTSSANPSNPGQVSFTATVTAVAPGTGIPTGNVTFSINGTPETPVALTVLINGADEATFTTTLAAGTYTITAVYDGDINFKTSSSAAFSQKVT